MDIALHRNVRPHCRAARIPPCGRGCENGLISKQPPERRLVREARRFEFQIGLKSEERRLCLVGEAAVGFALVEAPIAQARLHPTDRFPAECDITHAVSDADPGRFLPQPVRLQRYHD